MMRCASAAPTIRSMEGSIGLPCRNTNCGKDTRAGEERQAQGSRGAGHQRVEP